MINAETQLALSSDYPHWDFDLPEHDLRPAVPQRAGQAQHPRRQCRAGVRTRYKGGEENSVGRSCVTPSYRFRRGNVMMCFGVRAARLRLAVALFLSPAARADALDYPMPAGALHRFVRRRCPAPTTPSGVSLASICRNSSDSNSSSRTMSAPVAISACRTCWARRPTATPSASWRRTLPSTPRSTSTFHSDFGTTQRRSPAPCSSPMSWT